jgi:hypothetical protein
MYEDKISFGVMFLIIAGCKKETVRLSSDLQETWELVSSNGAWICHREYEFGQTKSKASPISPRYAVLPMCVWRTCRESILPLGISPVFIVSNYENAYKTNSGCYCPYYPYPRAGKEKAKQYNAYHYPHGYLS